MAGGLGLALAGPRQYHGTVVTDAWMAMAGGQMQHRATSAGRWRSPRGSGDPASGSGGGGARSVVSR